MLSPEEWGVVLLTLRVAAYSVAFGLPIAVLFAWLLVRGRFYGRSILDALVHLPMVLPPVVVGWLLLIIFGVRGPSVRATACLIRLVFTVAGASLACGDVIPFKCGYLSLAEAVDPGLGEAART
jgi:molybdate transport system permease protein